MARFPSLVLAVSLALATLAASPAAWAQAETRALLERIERLERDLTVMQRLNARGGTAAAPAAGASGAMVLTSPALSGQAGTSSAAPLGLAAGDESSGDIVAKLHLRVSNLETQFRTMTGQMDEVGFKINTINQRLDRMSADQDLRFKELEQKLPGAQASAVPPAQTGAAQAVPPAQGGAIQLIPPSSVQSGANAPSSLGAPPRNLGQLTGSELRQLAPPAQQQAAAAPPKPATAKETYDQALTLHRDGDHAGAERMLRGFMASYAKDPLASSAQYWLADTYYQRKDFEQAAILFAEGYKAYPRGNKAPDSLLKLAQSFSALNKKRESCIALAQLNAEFPTPAEPIKRAAAIERQKSGCT